MRILDGLQEIVGGIVDSGDELGVSFGIGGPENDDGIQSVRSFKFSNVLSNLLEMYELVLSRHQIISSLGLVGVDELRVVDGGKGDEVGHVRSDLSLEVVLENFRSSHRTIEGHSRNIPSSNLRRRERSVGRRGKRGKAETDDEIVGVHHGENVAEGDVDVLALVVGTESESRSPDERSEVVGILRSVSGRPGDVFLVGDDRRGESRSVVSTPSDEHETARRVSKAVRGGRREKTDPVLGTFRSVLNSNCFSVGLTEKRWPSRLTEVPWKVYLANMASSV